MGLLHKKKLNDLPRRRSVDTESYRPPADDGQRAFLRNRTLTGSTSDSLSTTHHRSELESPRTQAHHLAGQRRKIGLTLLGALAISILILGILLQFTAQIAITSSDVSISRKVDGAAYASAINDYLGANPMQRFRFFLDNKTLTDYLVSKAPEVESAVSASVGGIGQTDYALKMRKPVASWTINNTKYYVDATGIAFEKNYYSNPSVEIVDMSGINVQQGVAVASDRFLGFVGKTIARSGQSGYQVTQAIIPASTTRQLELRLKDVQPLIKLSIDRPVGEQIEDMSRALKYLTSHSMNPSYVDVRVSGKAYYQ
jgi:hypothetical protein